MAQTAHGAASGMKPRATVRPLPRLGWSLTTEVISTLAVTRPARFPKLMYSHAAGKATLQLL